MVFLAVPITFRRREAAPVDEQSLLKSFQKPICYQNPGVLFHEINFNPISDCGGQFSRKSP